MNNIWIPTKEENKELLGTPLGQVLHVLEKCILDKNMVGLELTLTSKDVKFVLTGKPIVRKRKSKSNNNKISKEN